MLLLAEAILKLQELRIPRNLRGSVAVITGASSGIGRKFTIVGLSPGNPTIFERKF